MLAKGVTNGCLQAGDRVEVAGIDGRSGVLRVWEQRERGVVLCTEAGFATLMGGGEAPLVGYPAEDVRGLALPTGE